MVRKNCFRNASMGDSSRQSKVGRGQAFSLIGCIRDIRVIRGQNKSHVEPHDVTDDPVVRYSPDHALF